MYLLGIDNCVYADKSDKALVCGVTDFEVKVDGRIIALTDANDTLNDGVYKRNDTS
jgi:hypothetical protein